MLTYRPEIDGLRGIAVLVVVLFHAGFAAFPGGYVGVDVFFVISGYLITRIIATETAAGTFTLRGFYERRARRILPALVFVCALCIPAAWLLLTPERWQEFTRSVVATALFSSNFFFWSEADYFSEAAELKPLLHTWSLAVEEQFYLFFPLLFLALRRVRPATAWGVQALLVVLSLAIATWQVAQERPGGFFLLPARWWEIGLGVLLALGGADTWSEKLGRRWREALAWLGLVLILGPVLGYSSQTPFPGPYALLPTLGAALVIQFARQGTVAGRWLANRALVGLGLVSFSVYLWHQPLFAFARNSAWGPPDTLASVALVAASLGMGYVGWRYVETPFRRGRPPSPRNPAGVAVAATVALALVGAALTRHVNWAAFDADEARILKIGEENRRVVRTEAFDRFGCFLDQSQDPEALLRNGCAQATGKPRLVLFGDSEAAHLLSGARSQDGFGHREVHQWTAASCRAIDFDGNSRRCRAFQQGFFANVLPTLRAGDLVMVASNWPRTHASLGDASFVAALGEMMDRLQATPASVVIVGATPDFVEDPVLSLLRGSAPGRTDAAVYLEVQDHRPTNRLLAQVAARHGFAFVDAARAICTGSGTLSCRFAEGDQFLFFDQGHLTASGSAQVAADIGAQLGVAPVRPAINAATDP